MYENLPCLVFHLRCVESAISVLGNRSLYFAYVAARLSLQFPAAIFAPALDCPPLRL